MGAEVPCQTVEAETLKKEAKASFLMWPFENAGGTIEDKQE
jgi:hypothetical protein